MQQQQPGLLKEVKGRGPGLQASAWLVPSSYW
jgi:hypothetical protein